MADTLRVGTTKDIVADNGPKQGAHIDVSARVVAQSGDRRK